MNTPILPLQTMNERIRENTIFHAVVDSSRTAVSDTLALTEWRAQHDLLAAKIFEQSDELGDEFEKVIWEGINLYGEAQFLMGWQLRGNPDKLFELPEDQ
jgi:hypothetical protein